MIAQFSIRLKPHLPVFARKWLERLESSDVGQRFARGTFWSLVGNAFSRALGLVTAIMVTRMLGKELYGQVSMVQSTVEMFSLVGGLGLSFTATKHVAEFRRTDPARTGSVIAMTSVISWASGAITATIAFFLAPWIAQRILNAPDLTNLLRVGTFLLLFGSVNAAQVGSLSGFEAFKSRARVNSISSVFSFFIIVLATSVYGIWGAVVGALMAAAFLCLLNTLAVRDEASRFGIPLNWRRWQEERRLLLNFSLPTVATGLILAPVVWVCNAMLASTPGGFAELGVYNAANQWSNIILFLPSLMGTVSMAIFSELIGSNQWGKARRLLYTSLSANALLIFPVIGLSVASPWLMPLYGKDFSGHTAVLVIRLGSAFLVALYTPIWPVLVAAGRLKTLFFINLGWGCSTILLTRLMIQWGANGMAIAAFSATLVYFVVLLYAALRVLSNGELYKTHSALA